MSKRLLLLVGCLYANVAWAQSSVFITEVADPANNTDARFVELYNASGSAIDLSGWTLQRYTNDNATPTASTVDDLTGTIPAGGFYIVAVNPTEFENVYGFAPDQDGDDGGASDSNGDDNIELLKASGASADIFGVAGEDGSGTAHDFADGRAERKASVTQGNAAWDANEWNVIAGGQDAPTDFDPGAWIGEPGGTETTVSFASTSDAVDEGSAGEATTYTITIHVTNPSDANATMVDVVVTGGTAGAADYTFASPTALTIPASAASGTVDVTIDGDDAEESSETIVFGLQNPSGGDNASVGMPDELTLTIVDDDTPPPPLVINELLADPALDDTGTPEVEGDANGDGTRDGSDDEFVELYNTSTTQTIDLSGYTLSDAGSIQHTFSAGTSLPPETAIIVFGGGTPTGIPVRAVTASTGSLSLNNGGDTVTLLDGSGNVVTSYTYEGEGGNDASLARDPDFTGSLVLHTSIASNAVAFSPGRDNTDNSALPVELADFTATVLGGDVRLRWRTLSETNNSGFEVQRLVDGAFVEEGFVAGAGSTIEPRTYEHTIAGLGAGTHVFRLHQVDYDGTGSYSPQVEAAVTVAHAFVVDAPVPNPTAGRATLVLTVQRAQDVRVDLFDALGRRVSTVFSGAVGASERVPVAVEGSALSSGMYFYRVTGETFNTAGRLVVIH